MESKNLKEWAQRITLQAAVIIAGALIVFGGSALGERIGTRAEADMPVLPAAEPAEGIGRKPAVKRYLGAAEAEEAVSLPAYDEYTEGEGPAPAWWDPEEPMAAEWEASYQQVIESNKEAVSEENVITELATQQVTLGNEIQRTDAGCPDWNMDTTLYGWDGHTAEPWELDLYARVFYLEFWGTSYECSKAGADAILNLWDTGKYGRTLFDALSYYDPDYGYTYRVYPHVWETKYDPDGLEWCREFTAERFYHGPEWDCVYFQLGGFHDPSWTVPLYKLDTVYFSGAKGWQ